MERTWLQKPGDMGCPLQEETLSSSMHFYKTELKQSQVVEAQFSLI